MTVTSRGRRPALIALVALLAGSLGVSAQDPTPTPATGTPPKGAPRLVVEETTYDWGQLLKGQATEHTFTVRNEGDAPLLIEKVQAT